VKASNERNRRVEGLLRQWLKEPRHAAPGACLDAETIAAWADGGLSGSAFDMARSHAADCARCQALLGALARTGASVGQPAPAPRRWLAWALPLTAGATAVALWVAVPRDRGVPATPPPAAQEQAAGIQAPDSTPLDRQAPAAAPPTAKAERAEAQAPPASRPAEKEERVAETERVADGLRKDAERVETDRLGASRQAAGRIAPASPASAAQFREAPPARQEAAAEARNRANARSAAPLAITSTAAILVISPDPSVRWRLAGSVVEQSTDGGSTWAAVLSGAPAELTAGSAPSTTICWVVGRGGVVLRTTDGRSFSRLTFPEMTDLAAVRASDALTASVTTTNGRVFSTTDGGATWH
jgi:hypothetical protein